MAVYIDIIWLLNLCFDGLLLLLTALFLKRKVIFWRLFAGAVIGSIIVVLMVTPYSRYVEKPIVKLFFSALIIWAAFGYRRFRYFAQNLLTFYFATFLLGGGIIAIHFFLHSSFGLDNGVFYTNKTGIGDPISWTVVLFGFPILWLFARSRVEDFKIRKVQYDQIVTVVLEIDEKKIELKGLVDSGNQLYDPISKTPVMIVNINKVQHILPKEVVELSKNIDMFLSDFTLEKSEWENRIRLIPYRGIGLVHQFLLAIKPDKILILYENNWIQVKKGLIAFNNEQLSSVGEFECIVHPKMLISNSIQPAS